MSASFYDMSPIDGEEGRTFSPGALSNVTINEDWLRAQIRFDYLIKTAQKLRTVLIKDIHDSRGRGEWC
jgi:hypothetical protein